MLLSFVPREHKIEAINSFDTNGVSPLMVATQGGDTFSDENLKHTTKVSYIKFLLKNNASLTIVDGGGKNALEHYRFHFRGNLDRMRCLTPQLINKREMNDDKRELETLLRPLLNQNEVDNEVEDYLNN